MLVPWLVASSVSYTAASRRTAPLEKGRCYFPTQNLEINDSKNVLHVARLPLARDSRQTVRCVPQVLGRQHGVRIQPVFLGLRLEHKVFQVQPALDEELALSLRDAQEVLEVSGHARHVREGVDQRVDYALDAAGIGAAERCCLAFFAGDCEQLCRGQLGALRRECLAERVQQRREGCLVHGVPLVDDNQTGICLRSKLQRLFVVVYERSTWKRLDRRQHDHNIRLLRPLPRSPNALPFDSSNQPTVDSTINTYL
ncbi:hypothetical protein TOPH_01482 [Tolypocladium ophioglossoides CBS 100239]|uniref:Uncharacterized protein n=1 Tax=Tolypocladium ophioglossoides (strain CBS 100239) TaxID=1163406 RepID=A0A0L0NHB5_TOLOC|nr:hypothetical protein TOPH_01482 [Tolypocladium ophioglossoides CBS 100239]